MMNILQDYTSHCCPFLQKRRGPYLPVVFSTSRLFFYAEMYIVLSFQSVVTEAPDLLK